ncbi:MAG: hypothetical protein KA035_03940 [Candidatus Levybacteria bacterium]|nr:hypothetical protein [Candidatus Levybacteria bacterium]
MRYALFFFSVIAFLGFFLTRVTFAVFSDSAVSQNNTFTAAAVFASPTPSLSPTPTPQEVPLFVSNPFTCADGASNTSVSKGNVSFVKTSSLEIQVELQNALPNTQYALWVNQNPGGCPQPSATQNAFIETDASGNGQNTLSGHALVGGATRFWVSMVGGSDVLRSKAVEL